MRGSGLSAEPRLYNGHSSGAKTGGNGIMKLNFTRAALAAVVALGVMTSWPVSSWANGGGFFSDEEDDDADLGPAFFGFVKDAKGKFVSDVEITATIKSQNSTYVLHTDITGHYRIPGFSKAID